MKYTVKLIYREILPDTPVDQLMRGEEDFRSVWRDVEFGRTEVVVEVEADDVREAVVTAAATVATVTSVIVDSAEVLSQQEHVHRLGGPAVVERFERRMTGTTDRL